MMSREEFESIFKWYINNYVLYRLYTIEPNYDWMSSYYCNSLRINFWRNYSDHKDLIISFSPANTSDNICYIFKWPKSLNNFRKRVDFYKKEVIRPIDILRELMDIISKNRDIRTIYGLK